MAFSGIVAVLGGATDVATIASAVAEVGTVMSVVGAVTNDPTLAKTGAIMGLAGGLTELGSGASIDAAASDAPPSYDPTTGNVVSNSTQAAANLNAQEVPGGVSPDMGTNGAGATDNIGLSQDGGLGPDSGVQTQSVPGAGTAPMPPARLRRRPGRRWRKGISADRRPHRPMESRRMQRWSKSGEFFS